MFCQLPFEHLEHSDATFPRRRKWSTHNGKMVNAQRENDEPASEAVDVDAGVGLEWCETDLLYMVFRGPKPILTALSETISFVIRGVPSAIVVSKLEAMLVSKCVDIGIEKSRELNDLQSSLTPTNRCGDISTADTWSPPSSITYESSLVCLARSGLKIHRDSIVLAPGETDFARMNSKILGCLRVFICLLAPAHHMSM